MQKIWNVKKYDEEYIDNIAKKYEISKTLARLITSRGVGIEEVGLFLNGNLEDLKDPFLMKDMDKFISRLIKAIDRNEKIYIYGDYDVDGVTSITIIYKFLKELGVDLNYYLPDRLEEGYGLNKEALLNIKKSGASLVITVDCGITAIEEIDYANSIGLDVCITDHHECSDVVPNAYSIVNTKQKDDNFSFKMHAGVGIAYKCITALALKLNLDKERHLKYLDIVAVGTISDIVPLLDENRIIASFGLQRMQETKNVGLRALFKISGIKEIDSLSISYSIAPRINACGRMGSASIAVKLFLEEDEKEAYNLANKLEEFNKQRQQVEKDIFNQAQEIIEKEKLDLRKSIVIWHQGWHQGVIGIVASRLVNIYSKPVILLAHDENTAKGSGRCQVGFSLYDALQKCTSVITQFGGHELAAGLSINTQKLHEFRDLFEEVVTSMNDGEVFTVVEVEDLISKQDLNIKMVKDINIMKPFGQSNKVPLFLYKGLKVQSIRTIKEDKHLKFTFADGGSLIDAVAFSKGDRRDELKISDRVDVLCNISVNTYNTPATIQLVLQDFKKCVE